LALGIATNSTTAECSVAVVKLWSVHPFMYITFGTLIRDNQGPLKLAKFSALIRK